MAKINLKKHNLRINSYRKPQLNIYFYFDKLYIN